MHLRAFNIAVWKDISLALYSGCQCNWNTTLRANIAKTPCLLSLHRSCIDLSLRNIADLFKLHMTGSFRCKALIYDLVSYSQVNHFHSVMCWPFLWTIILCVFGHLNTVSGEVHEQPGRGCNTSTVSVRLQSRAKEQELNYQVKFKCSSSLWGSKLCL